MGRHVNQTETGKAFREERKQKALARHAEALRLRQSGLTYQAVGERMGVSRSMAWVLVKWAERDVRLSA